jgi:hypothetical protein
MNFKNNIKKLAARQAQKKGASVSEKLIMSNNLTFETTKKPKLTPEQELNIRVGITVDISNPLGKNMRLDFSADLNRFRTIFKHVRSHDASIEQIKRSYHHHVVNLFDLGESPSENFFTVCMHYLVSLDAVERMLTTNPSKNFGFQVAISTESIDPNFFLPLGYDMWFELVNRYYNN